MKISPRRYALLLSLLLSIVAGAVSYSLTGDGLLGSFIFVFVILVSWGLLQKGLEGYPESN
jgi:hypothetical protein